VPGVASAVQRSRAAKLFICNVMTQPGETQRFTAADHLRALERHLGSVLVDGILVNDHLPTRLLAQYEAAGSVPVIVDRDVLADLGVSVVAGDLLLEGERVRHDPDKLALTVLGWLESRLGQRLLPRRRNSGPLSVPTASPLPPH